jgi:hypothetical protein
MLDAGREISRPRSSPALLVLEPAAEHASDLVGPLREVRVAAVRHQPEVLAEAERDAERVQSSARLSQRLRLVSAPVRDRERHQHRERVLQDHPSQKPSLRAREPVHVRVEPGAEIA